MTTDVISRKNLDKSRPAKSKPPKKAAIIFIIIAIVIVVAGIVWSKTVMNFAAPEIIAAATVGMVLIFASVYFLYTKVVFEWITKRTQLGQDTKRVFHKMESLNRRIEGLEKDLRDSSADYVGLAE